MNFLDPVQQYELTGCYIEITSRCNLRCVHCYNDSGVLKDEIDIETFKKTVNEFSNKDTYITISGGEPLMHPRIWEMLDILENKKFSRSLMITNATRIDKEVAARLTKYQIGVQVSLNGKNAEEHDLICGQGNFNRTIAGISNLVDAGKKNIVVRCMISKINKDNIPEFISETIARGIETVNLSALSVMGRGKELEEKIDMSLFEKQNLYKKLYENKEINNLKEKGYSIGIPESACSGGCPLIHLSDEKVPLSPRIAPSGNVYLCQLFDDERYILGNIHNNTLYEILESNQMCRFVNFLHLGISYIESCPSCLWKDICGKGCVAESLSRGSVQNNDGGCGLRRHIFAESVKEAAVSIQ